MNAMSIDPAMARRSRRMGLATKTLLNRPSMMPLAPT
jgi:hypothetical protein